MAIPGTYCHDVHVTSLVIHAASHDPDYMVLTGRHQAHPVIAEERLVELNIVYDRE